MGLGASPRRRPGVSHADAVEPSQHVATAGRGRGRGWEREEEEGKAGAEARRCGRGVEVGVGSEAERREALSFFLKKKVYITPELWAGVTLPPNYETV